MSRRANIPARGRKTPEAGTAEAGLPWRPIRVVHLSDLHFDERTAWDADTVLVRLVRDVEGLRSEVGAIDLVVVTGDIANKGRAAEYEQALRWLDGPLRSAAGVERSRVRVVPGNHDVDRGAITRTARALAANILTDPDPQQAAAEVLGSSNERAPLLQRKSAWLEFAALFHPGLGAPWWSETLDLQGWKVHLAGFDSALLSGSDDDARRLMLSRWQCNQLLGGADQADLAVALLHHPWDYLSEGDRVLCEEEIRRGCGLTLRGHLHEQRSRLSSDPDRDVLEVAAGSAYAGSSWANAWQLLELDPGRGEAKIHLRKWNGHDWIPDRNCYQKAPDGVATLSLRRSLKAPPPPPPEDIDVAIEPEPLSDYKQQVRSRADILAQVFHAPGGPTALSKVYVEVRLSADAGDISLAGVDGPFGQSRPWMRRWLSGGRGLGLPSGRFRLEDIVLDTPGARLAVVGDPGGGKTTLLRHTALSLLEHGPRLPVLLKVSELRGTLPESVALVYGTSARSHVIKAVRQNRAVILLDGMDEVTDRSAALAAVQRVASEARKNPVVLSSRPVGWQRPGPEFLELALCPLGRDEQRQLLSAWVDDQARVARALTRLDSSARLRRLAENPLLLTLVALLLREREDIPEQRGELYEKATSILLTRAADPERPQRRLREPDLAKQALAYAALRLHGRSEEVYLTSDLIEALQEQDRHRTSVREFWRGPGAFLAEVAETTGLLVPTTVSADGAPSFAFPHRTFREHLAAVALARDIGVHGVGEIPEEVLKNAVRQERQASVPPAVGELGRVLAEARERPERWSEVLALVCALVGTGVADALVRRLAAEGNTPLLHRVVAEAEGLNSDTVLAVMGVERGWDRWEERRRIIQEIPALVGNSAVAVRLLDRLRRETRDGNDLYWIRETLLGLAAGQGVDADVARDARATAVRIFDHIPAVDRSNALAILNPRWRSVPPHDQPLGRYAVGSDDHDDEKPVHKVSLTAHFQMLGVPVTWEMYEFFDPGHSLARLDFSDIQRVIKFEGGEPCPVAGQSRHPVYNITWYAATMFAAWVGARLPLESEWEVACRAGRATRYWSGDKESDLVSVGWFRGNSGGHPHAVAEHRANPWGLHDMHGNVREWCLDEYGPRTYANRNLGVTIDAAAASYRVGDGTPTVVQAGAPGAAQVLRGGSWIGGPDQVRSAARSSGPPSLWRDLGDVGFRLVLPTPAQVR